MILHITNILIYKFKISHIKIKTSPYKINNVTQIFDIYEPTPHILFISNKSTWTKTQHKLFRIDKLMCYGSKLTLKKGKDRLKATRIVGDYGDACLIYASGSNIYGTSVHILKRLGGILTSPSRASLCCLFF